MKLLVDTQCWLWMLADPDRLSARARRMLQRSDRELYLSAASAWEIAIKWSLGKLTLPADPVEYVPSRIEQSGVIPLPIKHVHAVHVARLAPHHRDPFDRLLVAQATVENMVLLTGDRQLEPYGVRIEWAD
ncbi:MAG: type II toxin-antitoxin system VapC family toxin [Acidobacteria bacterium]|nr:type II toxin-antitoxin system VapC family toxin [Acidobacteriota bacterium]